MFELIDYLKSKKVPIDGVGLQFHRWVVEKPVPGDKFYEVLKRIQERNLKFMMTELDISIPVTRFPRTDPNYGLVPTDPEDIAKQGESYQAFINMARSFKNCDGIQLWGVCDGRSWIPNSNGGARGAALLLDRNYKPKPAYEALANCLRLKN
jgi:endo-1,4-beta-xylanase